jgi:hypothetical protein
MEREAKEEMYCPVCNAQMARDLTNRISKNLPSLSVVMMAIEMVSESGCPGKLLTPIYEWAEADCGSRDGLTDEEKEKLKLVKWSQWATQ